MENSLGFRVFAVLPAGGIGLRMGLATPKQYCIVHERPLLFYTLQVFDQLPWIESIVVAVAEDQIAWLQEAVRLWGLSDRVVAVVGASTRHRSIAEGVSAIGKFQPISTDVVIVHDAVRPFVDANTLRSVTLAAFTSKAAGAVLPLVSTVIAANADGFLDHSLDRSKYRASQTPQAFHYAVIKKAYEQATFDDLEYGTECLHLALKYSACAAKLIDGPPELWKITYRTDLIAAEQLIHERYSQHVLLLSSSDLLHATWTITEIQSWIEETCQSVQHQQLSENSDEAIPFRIQDHQIFIGFCLPRHQIMSLMTQLQLAQQQSILIVIFVDVDHDSVWSFIQERSFPDHEHLLVFGIEIPSLPLSQPQQMKLKELLKTLTGRYLPALSGQLLIISN